jgi:hypothetical protein
MDKALYTLHSPIASPLCEFCLVIWLCLLGHMLHFSFQSVIYPLIHSLYMHLLNNHYVSVAFVG